MARKEPYDMDVAAQGTVGVSGKDWDGEDVYEF